jgi:hypothetical protein
VDGVPAGCAQKAAEQQNYADVDQFLPDGGQISGRPSSFWFDE